MTARKDDTRSGAIGPAPRVLGTDVEIGGVSPDLEP